MVSRAPNWLEIDIQVVLLMDATVNGLQHATQLTSGTQPLLLLPVRSLSNVISIRLL